MKLIYVHVQKLLQSGLFTRRLTKGNDYARVIACDYSEAMLLEARNRIQTDPDLNNGSVSTKLDLGKMLNHHFVTPDCVRMQKRYISKQ